MAEIYDSGPTMAELGDSIAAALPSTCSPLKLYQVGSWDEELVATGTGNTFADRWTQQFGPGIAVWTGHGNEHCSVMSLSLANRISLRRFTQNTRDLICSSMVPHFTTSLTPAFTLSNSCANAAM